MTRRRKEPSAQPDPQAAPAGEQPAIAPGSAAAHPRAAEAFVPFEGVKKSLVGDPDLTMAQVAERSNLPVQIVREVFDATDWAQQAAYDERDVAYAQAVAAMLDIFPLGAVVRSLRTRHRAMTNIVVNDLGTVRDRVVMPALADGAQAGDLAVAIASAAETLVPLVTNQLSEHYRHVLIRMLDYEALARGVSADAGREIDLAVAFVDVVGFTKLSGYIDPGELDHVLTGFEDLVTSAVARAQDMLLAKFIGDAAMLVASDPVHLAEVLVELCENQQRLAEAPRRGGLAYGRVLVREGDYYGPVPNLAARLTDHARPWSLLADEDLAARLSESLDVEPIGKAKFHGIGDRRPVRVRPKQAQA